MDRQKRACTAPGLDLKLGSPDLTLRRWTLSGWLISTRFWRAACPIGVTVRVAPVYLMSGGPPHLDGSSKTGVQRARSRFEVELFEPFPTLASFVNICLRFVVGAKGGGLGPNGARICVSWVYWELSTGKNSEISLTVRWSFFYPQ